MARPDGLGTACKSLVFQETATQRQLVYRRDRTSGPGSAIGLHFSSSAVTIAEAVETSNKTMPGSYILHGLRSESTVSVWGLQQPDCCCSVPDFPVLAARS